ncbi:MAG: hypothetical protein WDN28_16900 [Chthoniobacter sp.]
MLNPALHEWILARSANSEFLRTIDQTESALEQGMAMELVLRFVAFRNRPYTSGLDVHEYLDQSLIHLATDQPFDLAAEQDIFDQTFHLLDQVLGEKLIQTMGWAAFHRQVSNVCF